MRQPPKDTIDYYLLPNKILCSTYGLWPSSEKSSTIRRVFCAIHLMCSVVIACAIFLPALYLAWTNWRDLSILAGAGSSVLTVGQSLFKTVYLVVKEEKARYLLNELKSLWNSTDDPIERKSYEVFASWGRICTISFFVSGISTTFIFMVPATLEYFNINDMGGENGTRHLPFDIWYALAYLESPEFEVLYIGQILACFLVVCAVSGLDGMYLNTILLVAGQFKLISTWLNNIGIEINCNPIDSRNCPEKLTANLVKCIRHHQRLISLVEDVNTFLTPIIFIQVLTGSIQICLSGFAMISTDVGDNIAKFTAYLVTVTIQTVIYCWPGEILIQESQNVGYVAYLNIPWYQLSGSYRKQLLFIIMKSQKYCCISALTFKSLSFQTLTNVFNTSSSYFALLRKFQEP